MDMRNYVDLGGCYPPRPIPYIVKNVRCVAYGKSNPYVPLTLRHNFLSTIPSHVWVICRELSYINSDIFIYLIHGTIP